MRFYASEETINQVLRMTELKYEDFSTGNQWFWQQQHLTRKESFSICEYFSDLSFAHTHSLPEISILLFVKIRLPVCVANECHLFYFSSIRHLNNIYNNNISRIIVLFIHSQ
jgi:hypothetical protein